MFKWPVQSFKILHNWFKNAVFLFSYSHAKAAEMLALQAMTLGGTVYILRQ